MQISGPLSPSSGPESCSTCQGFPRVVGRTLLLICHRFTYVRVILDYLQHRQLFTETIGTGVESQPNATAGITQKSTELGLPVLILDLYA